MRLLDRLIAHATDRPASVALVALRPGGRRDTITYRALLEATSATAATVRERLATPAVVPVVAGGSIENVVAMLGVLAAGATFAVLHRKLKAPQIDAALAAAGSSFGLADAEGRATLGATRSEAAGRLPWADIERGAVGTPDVLRERHASAGCCLFTSGSTGRPKGVLVAGDDLDRRAASEAELFGLTPADVLLGVLPFSFDVGLNQLMSCLFVGGTLVRSDSWLPADVLRATAAERVTGVSGVPAIWNDLLNSPHRFDTGGPHRTLRYVTVSGGDLPFGRLARL